MWLVFIKVQGLLHIKNNLKQATLINLIKSSVLKFYVSIAYVCIALVTCFLFLYNNDSWSVLKTFHKKLLIGLRILTLKNN